MKALATALLLMTPAVALATESATLRFERSDAVVERDGKEITRTPLVTEKPVLNHPGVGNASFVFVADCFLAMREVHDLGPNCHHPPITLVELTPTAATDKTTLRFRWLKSYFQGAAFTSPSGKWGVALSGTHGHIDGLLVVPPDGTHRARIIEPPLNWNGAMGFLPNDDLRFPQVTQSGGNFSFVVHPTGEFELTPL